MMEVYQRKNVRLQSRVHGVGYTINESNGVGVSANSKYYTTTGYKGTASPWKVNTPWLKFDYNISTINWFQFDNSSYTTGTGWMASDIKVSVSNNNATIIINSDNSKELWIGTQSDMLATGYYRINITFSNGTTCTYRIYVNNSIISSVSVE